MWPDLSPVPGRLIFTDDVYPDYLTDLNILHCPSRRHEHLGNSDSPTTRVTDHSYFYLGYCLTSDAEVKSFVKAYRQAVQTGTGFAEDLKVEAGAGNNGSDTIYHFREDVELLLLPDGASATEADSLESRIPVMVERPSNHRPKGGQVVFLDGHVEDIPFPGRFPMTPTTIDALESLRSSFQNAGP